jgi:hypothetical protein
MALVSIEFRMAVEAITRRAKAGGVDVEHGHG